jgi:hypothetical protein
MDRQRFFAEFISVEFQVGMDLGSSGAVDSGLLSSILQKLGHNFDEIYSWKILWVQRFVAIYNREKPNRNGKEPVWQS